MKQRIKKLEDNEVRSEPIRIALQEQVKFLRQKLEDSKKMISDLQKNRHTMNQNGYRHKNIE